MGEMQSSQFQSQQNKLHTYLWVNQTRKFMRYATRMLQHACMHVTTVVLLQSNGVHGLRTVHPCYTPAPRLFREDWCEWGRRTPPRCATVKFLPSGRAYEEEPPPPPPEMRWANCPCAQRLPARVCRKLRGSLEVATASICKFGGPHWSGKAFIPLWVSPRGVAAMCGMVRQNRVRPRRTHTIKSSARIFLPGVGAPSS